VQRDDVVLTTRWVDPSEDLAGSHILLVGACACCSFVFVATMF
jgi:hypothetical protein